MVVDDSKRLTRTLFNPRESYSDGLGLHHEDLVLALHVITVTLHVDELRGDPPADAVRLDPVEGHLTDAVLVPLTDDRAGARVGKDHVEVVHEMIITW